uniref:Uncharacterized protein n=1 Tax=Anguilla anguilla TaxID=7936 RepID=A0A0E9TG20_ANGAN
MWYLLTHFTGQFTESWSFNVWNSAL